MVRDLDKWECKDERDRIYAIRNFIPHGSDIDLKPDYLAEPTDVFVECARQHILHEGLSVLLFAGLESRREARDLHNFFHDQAQMPADEHQRFINESQHLDEPELPSWVPEPRPRKTQNPNRTWLPLTFNAAMDRAPAAVLHKKCPHIIAVRGCVFDKIAQPLPTEATRPGGTGLLDYTQALVYVDFVWKFSKKFYEERGGYPTGELFRTVFYNVMTSDKTAMKFESVTRHRDPDWVDSMLSLLQTTIDAGSTESFEETISAGLTSTQDFALFLSCLSFLFEDDHCMLSEGGYMGLAPKCSRAGDVVAWINQLSCPVVLRPGPLPNQYQLVGPCFLEGLMRGQLNSRGSDKEVCTFIELV